MTDRLTFLNLPVSDLDASKAFFGGLGFAFDPKFTDQSAACMVISEQSFVMLLGHERFAEFCARPVADATTATGALIGVSAADRGSVDELADAALAAGGTPAKDAIDYGFMYGRSFFDLDGHHWEVIWTDPHAVEQCPVEVAATSQV